jgi:tetratricopeptide (TPR) repeat protein
LADYWRDRATEWAQEGGDHAMPGYVLLKKSQSAWDARDALRMLTLAQAVQDGPWPLPARVRAEAAQQEARGHAMIEGNIHAAERKLDEARALLADDDTASRTGPDAELAKHYDRSLLAVQTAICHREAGQPDQAVEIYREALDSSVFSPRDHAYFLSLMGSALAAANRPDEAAKAGIAALPVAAGASSVRTIRELFRLRSQLDEWADRPAVHEFANALPV